MPPSILYFFHIKRRNLKFLFFQKNTPAKGTSFDLPFPKYYTGFLRFSLSGVLTISNCCKSSNFLFCHLCHVSLSIYCVHFCVMCISQISGVFIFLFKNFIICCMFFCWILNVFILYYIYVCVHLCLCIYHSLSVMLLKYILTCASFHTICYTTSTSCSLLIQMKFLHSFNKKKK